MDTGKAAMLTLIGKGQSVRPIPEVKSAAYYNFVSPAAQYLLTLS